MGAQFLAEPIEPGAGSIIADGMAAGEPGLPGRFIWRGEEHCIAQVLEKWADSRPDRGAGKAVSRGGGKALYRGRHWFRVRTEAGAVMRIYFERHPRSRQQAKARWWLYAIE